MDDARSAGRPTFVFMRKFASLTLHEESASRAAPRIRLSPLSPTLSLSLSLSLSLFLERERERESSSCSTSHGHLPTVQLAK